MSQPAEPWRKPRGGASGSFLDYYGLQNPTVLWLLRQSSDILAASPGQLVKREAPPLCPDFFCLMERRPMVFRLKGWTCYHHPEPVTLPRKVEAGVPLPTGNMLSRVGEALDYVYDVNTGEWIIKPLCGPPEPGYPHGRPLDQAGDVSPRRAAGRRPSKAKPARSGGRNDHRHRRKARRGAPST